MVLSFYKKMIATLHKDRHLILMVVLNSEGSSPGRAGFKMFVSTSDIHGSIGGGMMEHKMVELARHLLMNQPFEPFIRLQIHRSEEVQNRSGMICSGQQTIAFYWMDTSHLNLLASILTSENETIHYTAKGIELISAATPPIMEPSPFTYSEAIKPASKAYIIGGGHVGLALSQVLSHLDFEIHVLDHREHLNTMDQNQFVHKKQVVEFQQISKYIEEGEHVFVIIMSFGYRTDKLVLSQLLGKTFKYLGMMGSQAKNKTLFEELRQEGFSEKDLQKVFAPIGVPIHSKTPFEIAVSVAAEIIAVKNG